MTVDILRLYQRWRLENVIVREGHNGDEAWACCPFHSETKPSFSVNLRTGKWHCLGCHERGRSINGLIAKIEGLTSDAEVSEFIRYAAVKQVDEIREDLRAVLRDRKDNMSRRSLPDTTSTDEWRIYASGEHPYMLKRGFESDTMRAYRIGYDASAQSVTIPVFEHGTCRFVFRRSVRRDARPKYLYPQNVTKSCYLWGLDKDKSVYRGKPVIITEGSLDALWLKQHGYEGAVAILGSFISREQVRKILALDPSEIILFFDNDDAGYDATKHAGKEFLDSGIQRVCYLRYIEGSGDDPQGCNAKEIQKMIRRKKHFRHLHLAHRVGNKRRIRRMLAMTKDNDR